MNRCPCNGSSGATVWKSWLSSVSGQLSGHCTDACRIFRCLPSGSFDALLLTVVQTRTDLVKLTPVNTLMLISLHHRFFRCLRFCGPADSVSLIFLVGPTRQPYAPLRPLQIETAAAPPSCPTPAPPLRRRSRATPPPARHHHCSSSAPPHPRRPYPHSALHPCATTHALLRCSPPPL